MEFPSQEHEGLVTSQAPNIGFSHFCREITNIDYLLFLLQVLEWKNQEVKVTAPIFQLRILNKLMRHTKVHAQNLIPQNHVDQHAHHVIDHIQDHVILQGRIQGRS